MFRKIVAPKGLLVNCLVSLMAIFASLLTGCSRPASPSLSPSPAPASPALISLPVPASPASGPSTAPAPGSSRLLVDDFDNCTGTNALGGAMGAAYNPPDSLKESYPQEGERGCVARLEYKISGWAAFWLKLNGADLREYRQLKVDVRADPQPGVPAQMKVELKRQGEVSIKYVSGIGTDWKTLSVRLADFGYAGYGAPVSSWQGMEELVFTFEASKSGRQGVVYLDNIAFEP